MERRDRPAVATFYADAALEAGAHVELDESATQHAKARRVNAGDPIHVTNGRGAIAHGTLERLTRGSALVSLETVNTVPMPPRLRLFVPVADRERMLWLAEKSAELAVSEWQPVAFHRSASVSPKGQGDAFMRKARARMVGAIEQSGGAWLPELCPERSLDDALVRANEVAAQRFLFERGGESLVTKRPQAADAMIGPEGGIEQEERMLIVDRHGWLPVSLGDTTLRFETAGVIAAGLLRGLMANA
ncbi:MAG TPA: RsmE family RNA methyltransferase [Gemmatimonadaceae bacterium]